MSDVTGSHQFKVGVNTQQGWRRHVNEVNGAVNYTFRNQQPLSITRTRRPSSTTNGSA